MYKVRFHLARGDHYMHWQIRDTETDIVNYVDPNEWSLELTNCKLINRRTTAEKIYKGSDKTVCSWVECTDYKLFIRSTPSIEPINQIYYNPRVKPYWTNLLGQNLDNSYYDSLVSLGKNLYLNTGD